MILGYTTSHFIARETAAAAALGDGKVCYVIVCCAWLVFCCDCHQILHSLTLIQFFWMVYS